MPCGYLGGTNWYLMTMVVISISEDVDASLYMKWNPGFILRVFKSLVNYVKANIISLSLLSFISVDMMV